MSDLVLELFSEEIPAGMQRSAAINLKKLFVQKARSAGLEIGNVRTFYTPRRLTIHAVGMAVGKANTAQLIRGPRIDAGDKAIAGFLEKHGFASVDQVEVLSDPEKGDYLVVDAFSGVEKNLSENLSGIIKDIIENFPWPKSQRWGAGRLRWARPLHSILAILCDDEGDATRVQLSVEGLSSVDTTLGHRFMSPEKITVSSFEQYQNELLRHKVILCPDERKKSILEQASQLAEGEGLQLVEDRELLDEVCGLIEYPVALIGRFDPQFLELPRDVIRLTIRQHQKCFVLEDAQGCLSERFVTIANIDPPDRDMVIRGNERVIEARLKDAQFFWHSDISRSLEELTEMLARMTFHEKLGSVGQRSVRIQTLARKIAEAVSVDIDVVERAASWAKADLASSMVAEFPELQGKIGAYLAQHSGEKNEVVVAVRDHYLPIGSKGSCPEGLVSNVLSLADKLDHFINLWSAGERPTSSKDPLGIRRSALSAIKILLTQNISVNLRDLGVSSEMLEYLHKRLVGFLKAHGIPENLSMQLITSSGSTDDLAFLGNNIRQLSRLVVTKEGEDLIAVLNRAQKLVEPAVKLPVIGLRAYDTDRFTTEEERDLSHALHQLESSYSYRNAKLLSDQIVHKLIGLTAPLEAFLDNVEVHCDDVGLRETRVTLLRNVTTAATGLGVVCQSGRREKNQIAGLASTGEV